MRFHVLTLFPQMIEQGLSESITGRALKQNIISLNTVNIRDFAHNKHNKVDDYTYGGGAGMLMQAEPVYQAVRSVVSQINKCNQVHSGDNSGKNIADENILYENTSYKNTAEEIKNHNARLIYVTPQGRVFNQQMAAEFAKCDDLIFLCGHYEGIDERVLEETVTDYVSIGDYVLTGGELPSMVMIDAISRLVPGVLHNDISAETESFHGNLLEYPQYSRPVEWHDKKVPEVLMSGNQKKIDAWRLEKSIERTKERRPDLYAGFKRLDKCREFLMKNKLLHIDMIELINRGCAEILFEADGEYLLWTDYSYFENVAHDLFQGLSMLFVHSQHKEGQHNQHHTHSRYTVSGRFSEQKEKRYANKRSAREADKLPLGQIEHDLCFDFC